MVDFSDMGNACKKMIRNEEESWGKDGKDSIATRLEGTRWGKDFLGLQKKDVLGWLWLWSLTSTDLKVYTALTGSS